MIRIPIIDILFLAGTTFGAVANRGTLIGWMCTFLVFWNVWNLIQFYREHP